MATENAQKLVYDDTPLLTDSTAPEAAKALPEETTSNLVALEPERRLAAVRDINSKLDELDQSLSRLTASFGQSQEQLNGSLLDIQRRAARTTADILALLARADQGDAATAALDARLQEVLAELQGLLAKAGSDLGAQQERLSRLEGTQQSLAKLHDTLSAGASKQGESIRLLDKETRAQAEVLQILSEETREQLQVNRTHIDGLHALHREQTEAWQALAQDVELLRQRSMERLDWLEAAVAAERHQVRRYFQFSGAGIGVLVAVIFGVMAYLHLHPSTIPVAVRTELTGVEGSLGKLAATEQGDVQSLLGKVGALGSSSDAQAAQISKMQVDAKRSAAQMRQLRKSDLALRKELAAMKKRLDRDEHHS